MTVKLMMFDLNWSMHSSPHKCTVPSAPQDWAFVDPREYFQWHLDFGNNVVFLQAYTYGGYAFYPSRLGPVAPGPGSQLLPKVFELTRKKGMPFWSYFCVGADVAMNSYHPEWVVPGSRAHWQHGFLGPETPWTDLLCARIREFLSSYPADWLIFDWFCYGEQVDHSFPVQPAWFVERPFQQIIGRPMPADGMAITPEESLAYKRAVLEQQFHRILDAVKSTSPETRVVFSPPYWGPAEPLWDGHAMLAESDGLVAEYSKPEIMEWLLRIRKPGQHLMGTPMGAGGTMEPVTILEWVERGCDLLGYFWAEPPGFAPDPSFGEGLAKVQEAFRSIK
jgi:hypothetical protein